MVLCKGIPALQPVSTFKATLVTLATMNLPIIPGSSFELYIHGEETQCHVVKLYSMTSLKSSDKGSDNVPVIRPKCIGASRHATVKIETERPVCVEPFEACKALGRFALRSRGKTCAVGVVVVSSSK
jgi:elongation factor 1 alpha-like protein